MLNVVYVNFLPLNFVFSENGLVAHKDGKLIGTKEFINFTLRYIADLDIPIKRMLNVSPIGRNCSQEERDKFERYDMVHNICPKMVSVLREMFAHLNLTFSIGGQISFDMSDSTDGKYHYEETQQLSEEVVGFSTLVSNEYRVKFIFYYILRSIKVITMSH
ncbi:hypothetical protein UlMin_000262 [Ulmus minor]